MTRNGLTMTVLGIMTFWLCSCSLQDLEKQLALLANQMIADKSLMESLAQDVKKAYTETDPNYQAAKAAYSNARSAYEGYLGAVRASVKVDRDSQAIQQVAADAQQKTSAFVNTAVQALTKDRSVRPVGKDDTILTLPARPMVELRKLPKKYRLPAIDRLEQQIAWRGWDQL